MFLLVDDPIFLATFLFVESKDSVLIESPVHCLFQKLYDSLLLTEPRREYFNDSCCESGVNVRLYIQSSQIFEIAETKGDIHSWVFAQLNHEFEVKYVENIGFSF